MTPHTTFRLPPGAKAQLDYLRARRGETGTQIICTLLDQACRRLADAPAGEQPAPRGRRAKGDALPHN